MAKVNESLNQKLRVKIQNLIASNIIMYGGDFHANELNEDGLIYDIQKNFKLIPRTNGIQNEEQLRKLIKVSTKKARGLFNSKEFKQSLFLNKLNEAFQIEIL